MGCKIGASPVPCSENLSAVRLETTKVAISPTPLDSLEHDVIISAIECTLILEDFIDAS